VSGLERRFLAIKTPVPSKQLTVKPKMFSSQWLGLAEVQGFVLKPSDLSWADVEPAVQANSLSIRMLLSCTTILPLHSPASSIGFL
jgi:hypothetical protein